MANELMAIYKEDGVKDIAPLKARAAFAKALKEEREQGHTTPEALVHLDTAIAEIQAEENKKA